MLAVTAHESTVDSLLSPATPTAAGGSNTVFTILGAPVPLGCTLLGLLNNWTLTCNTSGATYRFAKFTVPGGISVNVVTSANAFYTFSDVVSNTGPSLSFGAGTFTFAKGIVNGNGSTTTFGAGSFTVGPGATPCIGATAYSLCNYGVATVCQAEHVRDFCRCLQCGRVEDYAREQRDRQQLQYRRSRGWQWRQLGWRRHYPFLVMTENSSLFQIVGNFYQLRLHDRERCGSA